MPTHTQLPQFTGHSEEGIRSGGKFTSIPIQDALGDIQPTKSIKLIASNFNLRDQRAVSMICLSPTHILALCLCILAGCVNIQAQSITANTPTTHSTQKALNCTKDSQCPSGQRCGFVGGCKSKGKCVVPSGNSSCIDPGGRCGCDGRPVDIFCAIGSHTEFTSAPVNAVGPCPKSCTDNSECISGLLCKKGLCLKP
jgi:hypothetical protein